MGIFFQVLMMVHVMPDKQRFIYLIYSMLICFRLLLMFAGVMYRQGFLPWSSLLWVHLAVDLPDFHAFHSVWQKCLSIFEKLAAAVYFVLWVNAFGVNARICQRLRTYTRRKIRQPIFRRRGKRSSIRTLRDPKRVVSIRKVSLYFVCVILFHSMWPYDTRSKYLDFRWHVTSQSSESFSCSLY